MIYYVLTEMWNSANSL